MPKEYKDMLDDVMDSLNADSEASLKSSEASEASCATSEYPDVFRTLANKVLALSGELNTANAAFEDIYARYGSLKKRFKKYRHLMEHDKKYALIINRFFGGTRHNMSPVQVFFRYTAPKVDGIVMGFNRTYKKIINVLRSLANKMDYRTCEQLRNRGFMKLAIGTSNYHGLSGMDLIVYLAEKLNNR